VGVAGAAGGKAVAQLVRLTGEQGQGLGRRRRGCRVLRLGLRRSPGGRVGAAGSGAPAPITSTRPGWMAGTAERAIRVEPISHEVVSSSRSAGIRAWWITPGSYSVSLSATAANRRHSPPRPRSSTAPPTNGTTVESRSRVDILRRRRHLLDRRRIGVADARSVHPTEPMSSESEASTRQRRPAPTSVDPPPMSATRIRPPGDRAVVRPAVDDRTWGSRPILTTRDVRVRQIAPSGSD